jgi:hypothetical protein
MDTFTKSSPVALGQEYGSTFVPTPKLTGNHFSIRNGVSRNEMNPFPLDDRWKGNVCPIGEAPHCAVYPESRNPPPPKQPNLASRIQRHPHDRRFANAVSSKVEFDRSIWRDTKCCRKSAISWYARHWCEKIKKILGCWNWDASMHQSFSYPMMEDVVRS